MKKFLVAFILMIFSCALIYGQEISLYDSDGEPRAYIDADDEDCTIYLWSGEPVCYLVPNGDNYHIYGFNGEHLGWFEDGIVRDHNGEIVGFQKGAVSRYTRFESYKPYKHFKPYKSFK